MGIYYDVKGETIIDTTTIGIVIYDVHQGGYIFNVLTIISTITNEGFRSLSIVLE